MACEDIPSLLDLQNTKKHVDDLGRLMGTGEGDSTNEVTGQIRPTYNKVMKSVGFKPGSGDFTTGFTVMPGEFDVAWYDPVSKNWYSYLGVIPSTSGHPVAPGTNPVGSVDWAPRTDEALRDDLADDGGVQLVKNAVRWFDSIQLMLAATDLQLGQKVCTGATTWKIITGNKGWPLSNGTQYALPLNGVWVEDAGADATGASDSYAAIMYVINKYNADTKRKFAVCFGDGYYKSSASIALHGACSDIILNFGGATIEATANMASLVSCPAIGGLRIKHVLVQHAPGVTLTDAMIHINTQGATNKTIRHHIDDISSGLITGAPRLLLCDNMWESEIGRIRCDRDVAGKTGEIITLRSCVNNTVQAGDIGYCAVGVRIAKHPDVTYACEGITFNGGVMTYAKIPVAIDFGTAIRLKGMVLDFCETSGPTLSNGQDITLEGCWIANDTTSNGWSGFVGLPATKAVKIIGCHFVNNSPNQAFCASLNVPESVFAGNTAQGCQPGFRYASGVHEYGNQYGINGVGSNFFSGGSFTFEGDPGIAPNITFKSGISAHSPNQLLQRVTLGAQSLHPNNVVQIDHFEGNFADVPILKLAWNGAYKYLLDGANIHLLSAGGGIVLTSPNGLVTKTLRLSNAGAIELV